VIKPKIAGPPKLLGASWTSIALAWDKVLGKDTGGTDIESYYLEWQKGTDKVQTRVVDRLQNDFTVADVHSREPLAFKLRAKNSCGFSQFSAPVYFRASSNMTWFWLILLLIVIICVLLCCTFGRFKMCGYECGNWGGCAKKEIEISEDCKFVVSGVGGQSSQGDDIENADVTERRGLMEG